jgi:DNA-binding CsgD family transcriptional regulator
LLVTSPALSDEQVATPAPGSTVQLTVSRSDDTGTGQVFLAISGDLIDCSVAPSKLSRLDTEEGRGAVGKTISVASVDITQFPPCPPPGWSATDGVSERGGSGPRAVSAHSGAPGKGPPSFREPRGVLLGMAVSDVDGDRLGRERELSAIGGLLDAAAAGPAALLLEGDAGIGKTTVWQEGVRAAAARGHVVLSSRASPAETRLSYGNLGDLLDPVIDAVLGDLPEPQHRALAFATLRREPEGRAPDQRTVSVAFLSVLRLLAKGRPVVIAVDDVQWMDPSSARVLRFAIRRLSSETVGVLATARLGIPHDDPFGADDPATAGRLERLLLGPLSMGAIHRLVRTRLGTVATRPVLVKLYETSEGNPFFALQLARALSVLGGPPAPGEPLPVPHDLRDLVARQLQRLSGSVRELLLYAALSARPTEGQLERALGQEVRRLLTTAFEAGALEREGASIRFTHPLVAAAISDSTPVERRRAAHRRLAAIVTDSEEQALHLALAATGPNEHVAALLDAAALRAESRGAPDAAADLYEQAAGLTPSKIERARRFVRAAECRFQSGDGLRAEQLLRDLMADVPPGPLRAEAVWQLALIRVHDDNLQTSIRLLELALEESKERSPLRCSIELALAMAIMWGGNLPGSLTHARAAVKAVDSVSEPGLLAAGLAVEACIEFLTGSPVSSATLERAAELERSADRMLVEWRPSFLEGFMLKAAGDLQAARSRFEALHVLLREQGDEASMPFLLGHMSELEAWAGNIPLAARHADEAVEISERNGQPMMRAAALYAKGLAHAYAGRLEEARASGEQALALALPRGVAPVIQFATSLLGFISLTEGDPAEADRLLRPLAEMLETVGLGEPDVLRFMPDAIEALIELGELDRAVAPLDLYEGRARRLGRRWSVSASERCRGLLAAARGDLPGALSRMDRALEAFDGLPLPFELARTMLAKGRVERRAKGWRDARASLAEAVRIFEQIGCGPWAEKARGEMARIGGRPRGPGALSDTEQRVAELIGAGHTTRQVADALFLTPRAVEANLTKVYRKLGIHSRAELGARISKAGATSST